MRPSGLYLLPALLAVALFGSARALHQQERQRALELWTLAMDVETTAVATAYRNTFRGIYEGLRTIARLPSVRRLERGAELGADARTTAQEIYNNLAQHVAMSEAYIVPVSFDPDALDPVTGEPQEPLTTFDSLIVGRHADRPDRAPGSPDDAAPHAAPAAEVEEIELYEYREMRSQLARFGELCPDESRIDGLAYPAVCSTEVTTCDNRFFSPSRPVEADRQGLVYSVPFFDASGQLGGCISGIILTRVLQLMLPGGSYALHNSHHGLLAPAQQPGIWQRHLDDILAGRPAATLIYSRSLPLHLDDLDGGWRLWVGRSEAEFDASPYAQKAFAVFVGLSVAIAALIGGLAFAARTIARQRRLDRERADQLERARDAAVELARAKSNFVAVASHEIRTPMNGVLGMMELLLQGDLPLAEKELAETARQSAQTLVDLLQSILDYSRIEAGKLELESVPLDPVATLEDAVQLLAPAAAQQSLRLLLQVDDDVPGQVIGDPGALRQLATNLVGNAVKFTPAGSITVHLAADRDGDAIRLHLAVIDTGIGLDPAQRSRLFQPFAQADSSTTRRFGGSGLGLAISHGLVAAMSGTLDYEPTPGGGTTFRCTMRLRPGPAATGDLPLRGHTVAIVDPEPERRRSVASALRRLGADSREYASVAAAAVAADCAPTACMFAADAADTNDPTAELRRRWPGARWIRMLGWNATAGVPASGGDEVLCLPARLDLLRRAVLGGNARPRAATGAPAPRSRGAGRALVVDDNEVNLRVACLLMQKLGFQCVAARDGAAAVQLATDTAFDIVLMDWQMPVVDGITATRQIRAFEAANARARTPVIAVTANAMPDDERLCREAGMDGFLTKPISSATLRRVLATAGAIDPVAATSSP